MKRGLGLALGIVLCIVGAVPTATADPGSTDDGELYFGLTDRSPDDVSGVQAMVAETPGTGATVGIPLTQPVTWVADEPSAVAFDIAKQDAIVHLAFTTVPNQEVTVRLGVWSDDGFTEAGSDTKTVSTLVPEGFTVTVDSINVAEGDRPALQVETSGIATVDTSSATAVHFPEEPPPEAYPTPELGSLVLSGVGLVGLMATARIRERAD